MSARIPELFFCIKVIEGIIGLQRKAFAKSKTARNAEAIVPSASSVVVIECVTEAITDEYPWRFPPRDAKR